MLSLYRALYVSRATAGVLENLLETASQIVATSSRNNAHLGVTGALLAHEGWFVQALEGERARLSGLLLKLGRDPRHHAVEILDFAPARSRLFGAWGMAHARLTPACAPLLQRISDATGAFDPSRMDSDTLLSLLQVSTPAAAAA